MPLPSAVFDAEFHSVVQVVFELEVALLPQPPKSWDYGHVQQHRP